MMAAYGRHSGAALEGAARILALFSGGGVSYIRLFVLYVLATQDKAGAQAFDAALRRQGGEIMSYAQQLLEEGRADLDVIEAATGLNETGFRALKERLSASNRA